MTKALDNNLFSWSFMTRVGVPFSSVHIDYYYTQTERMPILIEYVLRLLKIVESAPVSTIRFYLGLSRNEMKVLIDELLDKDYICQTSDGNISLNEEETDSLFLNDGGADDIPRLHKLSENRKLITVIRAANECILLNNPPNDDQKHLVDHVLYDKEKPLSYEEISQTFQTHFDILAIEEEEQSSFHSVKEISQKKSGLYAVPVKLTVDSSGNFTLQVCNRDKNKDLDKLLYSDVFKVISLKSTMNYPVIKTNPRFIFWNKVFSTFFNIPNLGKTTFSNLVESNTKTYYSSEELSFSIGDDVYNYVELEDYLAQTASGAFIDKLITSQSDCIFLKCPNLHGDYTPSNSINKKLNDTLERMFSQYSYSSKLKLSVIKSGIQSEIPESDPDPVSIVFEDPQSSFILIKGKGLICSYYLSIGWISENEDKRLYVPVTAMSTDACLIKTAEKLFMKAISEEERQKAASVTKLEKKNAEDKALNISEERKVLSQPTSALSASEINKEIQELITSISKTNDYVYLAEIGGRLGQNHQDIKEFWKSEGVKGISEFVNKYSDLYEIKETSNGNGVKIYKIRSKINHQVTQENNEVSVNKLTTQKINSAIKQIILIHSPTNDYVNIGSVGGDLGNLFKDDLKQYWNASGVKGILGFAREHSSLYDIRETEIANGNWIIEIRIKDLVIR